MVTTIGGLRTLRAFGAEQAHHQRFLKDSADAGKGVYRLARLSSWINPVSEAGYLVTLALIIASMDFWGTAFATTLTAVAMLYRLQPHTREIEQSFLTLAHNGPRVASVRSTIEDMERAARTDGTEDAAFESEIAFRDVVFRYGPEEPEVLRNVSFSIPAGKTTALVGASGTGKTTVVQILLRLWDIESGEVLVDGRPLSSLRRESWLALLGAAGQDIDIVEGTVLENVCLGARNASREDALAAAKAAGVDLFVEELPKQYDTWMTLEGQRFSGGQRQRIALARAILRNPQLLILDEAMNALDVELENRIRAAIEERMGDQTILMITHRLENIRTADHIVWIDKGRIVGEGPPEQFADTLFTRFAGDLN
jgi:ABC-type multidrug transport system fused ATPase/permease subunit